MDRARLKVRGYIKKGSVKDAIEESAIDEETKAMLQGRLSRAYLRLSRGVISIEEFEKSIANIVQSLWGYIG